MPRKSKKRPVQRRTRPATPPPAAAPATAERPQPRTGGDQTLVRSVEMSLTPRAVPAARRTQRGILIGDDDPAIPLDRVPYFTSDLARLGIVAAVMLVLLVVGSQLIPLFAR